eukprot:6202994-Pleurochrysis_carterae.AAC.1
MSEADTQSREGVFIMIYRCNRRRNSEGRRLSQLERLRGRLWLGRASCMSGGSSGLGGRDHRAPHAAEETNYLGYTNE